MAFNRMGEPLPGYPITDPDEVERLRARYKELTGRDAPIPKTQMQPDPEFYRNGEPPKR